MEQNTEIFAMLSLISCPAFAVRDGLVLQVNQASAMIQPGMEISKLLETGAEEYADFQDGCLYLTLNCGGQILESSVRKVGQLDIFTLEEQQNKEQLNALALAARELREPMAGLMITADRIFAQLKTAREDTPQIEIGRMHRDFHRVLRLLSNMSDAARYVSDPGRKLEIQEMGALVEEIFLKAQTLVEHAGIELHYEGLSRRVYSLADPEKLERAIYNILANALKFTPRGGTIRGKLTQKGNKLILSIQDDGEGIRLHSGLYGSYTRQLQMEDGRHGIGLGLVLIRSAARIHGGTVLIDHPDGKGTRVTMTLAIRQGKDVVFQSPRFRVDYAGERDHGLLELSESLPPELYTKES